ncbi:MAG: hypothetical protein F6J89_24695, partial [Symploca sp. SIO1C4]|nr:hypothetical protein [Symploca sp. SIO1C4]
MADFPKPPSLPLGSQKMLAELVDYYRQLAEYHEHAAAVAREEYNYAKALLEPHSVVLGENNWQKTLPGEGSDRQRNEQHHFPTLNSPVSSAYFNSVGGLPSEPKKQPPYQQMGTKEAIARVLEANRGIMLRVDYIIREMFGELEEAAHTSATVMVNSILSEGESEGLCYSIS